MTDLLEALTIADRLRDIKDELAEPPGVITVRLEGVEQIKGDQGEVGPEGPQGETGPQGEQGIQGEKGEKGDKGDVGPPGESIKGDPGPQGEKGERGERGAIGPRGRDGASGGGGGSGGGASLSDATPLVESGAGSAGTGTLASRDDHVHPADPGGGAVDSVNGATGVVVLTAGDIGFSPAGTIAATDVQAAIEEVAAEAATAGGASVFSPAVIAPCKYALFSDSNGNPTPLSYSYDDGAAGVGSTLTASANGALAVDDGSVTPDVGDRLVVFDPYNGTFGIFVVTDVGDGSNPWVLTRAADMDTPATFVRYWVAPITDGPLFGGGTCRVGKITDPAATVATFSGSYVFDLAANGAFAWGGGAIAQGRNSLALGPYSEAITDYSMAIGPSVTKSGSGILLGYSVTSSANLEVAVDSDDHTRLGGNNTTTLSGAFAIQMDPKTGGDPAHVGGFRWWSTDSDPTSGAGLPHTGPSLAVLLDPIGETLVLYQSTGPGDTDWALSGGGSVTPATDPGDIADPTLATAEDVALKLNALMAAMRTAGSLA